MCNFELSILDLFFGIINIDQKYKMILVNLLTKYTIFGLEFLHQLSYLLTDWLNILFSVTQNAD